MITIMAALKAIVTVVMPIFKPVVPLMVLPLHVAVEAAMLTPAHTVIVGAGMAIVEPVVLAVMAILNTIMLPAMPVFQLVVVVVVSATMLRHGRRRKGKSRNRTKGSENNHLHGQTPLQLAECALLNFYPPLTRRSCAVHLAGALLGVVNPSPSIVSHW